MTTLFVANDGGHLQQLVQLAPRFDLQGGRAWATNESAQSHSLLDGEEVYWFPHSAPRDIRAVMSSALLANRMLADLRPSEVVSTGASLALAVLPLARARGIPVHYVESATRVIGPSLSGKVISRLPGARLYTQYAHLESGRWRHRGSVFDDYEVVPPPVGVTDITSIVVSVGTSREFGFRRLLARVLEIADSSWRVFWQTGSTDVSSLPLDGFASVPSSQLRDEMLSADVVITHAGTGSAIASLEAGKKPILVPREVGHGEHVDGHQHQIANELRKRGLAWSLSVEELDRAAVLRAAGWRVFKSATRRPFPLI